MDWKAGDEVLVKGKIDAEPETSTSGRVFVKIGAYVTAADPELIINGRKFEAMKVWYALFTTLIDSGGMTDIELLLKLRMLSDRIKKEVAIT